MKPKLLWGTGALMVYAFLIYHLILLSAESSAAQPAVIWPSVALDPVATGFDLPVGISNAGDGSNRLFILEQEGRIRILKDGLAVTTPFLDLTARVFDPAGSHDEEGLLGLAFPPGFGDYKSHFYVFYTRTDGNNQVSRFHLSSNPDVADPNSEEPILEFIQPFDGHNGGQLAFGPDGYLYIGTGDGGGTFDPQDKAENPDSLLGKILRIDVERIKTAPISGDYQAYLPLIGKLSDESYITPPYKIPDGNPFAGVDGVREEIWALGLRNPWRFSFDRETGDLYISDVGEDSYEEVNFQHAAISGGAHYGWNTMEGPECVEGEGACNKTVYALPVAAYPHTNDPYRCAIVGGSVYRGSRYPELQGIYFFTDYCSGEVWGLQHNGGTWQMQGLAHEQHEFTSFGEDEAGEVYLVEHHDGTLLQLVSP